MLNLPKMPSFSLDGKRALVVGASSGIGLASAVALAEHGAQVTLAARKLGRLKIIEDEMRSKGWETDSIELDVSDISGMEIMLNKRDPYDILVNSAGIAKHSLSLETLLSDFDRVLSTNLRGAYFLTQIVAKRLKDFQKPGSLINVSSQMGHVGGNERAVYCASKHGMEGFTKAMAIEFGPYSIRINTICPTFILTDLTFSTFQDPEKRKWIEEKIKLGRVGTVEDIMGAIVYLASDASSLVTGSAILVDGGWTAE